MISCTMKIKYNRLFNPILIFCPFLIAYYIIVRIGMFNTYFYPRYIFIIYSANKDDSAIILGFFKDIDYVGILGIIP